MNLNHLLPHQIENKTNKKHCYRLFTRVPSAQHRTRETLLLLFLLFVFFHLKRHFNRPVSQTEKYFTACQILTMQLQSVHLLKNIFHSLFVGTGSPPGSTVLQLQKGDN